MALDPVRQALASRLDFDAFAARLAEAEAAAAVAQGTANTAVSNAGTAQSSAVAAQSTADDALDLATTVQTQATSAKAETDAIASTANRVLAPGVYQAGSPLLVGLYCSTAGATIHYRINGGSYSTYSTAVALTSGQLLEAYASKVGMTDSVVTPYSAP